MVKIRRGFVCNFSTTVFYMKMSDLSLAEKVIIFEYALHAERLGIDLPKYEIWRIHSEYQKRLQCECHNSTFKMRDFLKKILIDEKRIEEDFIP